MNALAHVIFLVLPGVHLLDLTGPVQVFYEAATYGQPYQLTYCSYRSAVPSSAGLGLGPLVALEGVAPQPGDFVFVPGLEMEYLRSAAFREEGAALFAWLRTQYARGVRLCAICTGAFVLAEAGVLDGRKCTTHWRRLAELQARYPRLATQGDTLFVQDSGLYTSAGVTAGIDLALYLLEERHGPLFATKVARELVVYLRRGAGHRQQSVYLDYRNHLHAAVHQVQDWLTENLATGATLEALAELVNMSPRTLTRTFRNATGISINAYTTALRRELAATLRRNPALTQEAIAAQCGFRSVRQLQRLLLPVPSSPNPS
ncbi:AraC family transcriptional regulator [Hymenobacter sp. HMF4947]|uniref:AraC family transcriptional regulator n=1 Tax=Hymenobacter ginkgonis TaxID=2682976 RepID=A0A7K1TH97_9BACT|nr:DJ-1/PfpI family protein [Hymenobacter ginkgonis]MVN77807.1 AraC family transcriptional regulator [Hymenobacter ginkgonis]